MTTRPDENRPVLDRIRIRHDRHGIDRVVGKRQVHKPEHRIGQRARTHLHAGLRGSSAFDRETAWHFHDAGEKPQRVPQASTAGHFFGFGAANPLVARQRLRRNDGRRRNHFDSVPENRKRQVDRNARL